MEDGKLDRALWVDWRNQVISFRQMETCELKFFPSPEERLLYAFEKCASGFRIQ